MKKILNQLKARIGRYLIGTSGDWMGNVEYPAVGDTPHQKMSLAMDYNPDRALEKELSESVHPFNIFWDKFQKGEAIVSSATLMLAKFSESGKITDYKLVKLGRIAKTDRNTITESARLGRLTESAARCLENYFDSEDAYSGMYDQNNYTEYVPLLGGPYNRQMYLTDMLAAQQKSFEAYNHNSIAHRLVDIVKQYAFARGYKVQSKDAAATDIWNEFEKKFNIKEKLVKNWSTDYLLMGELFLDKEKITSIDSSTIWDIITDPEDISEVYYYYQSFPTAFQQFTGYDVKGVPGSRDVKSIEYIIRQLPYDRVFHLKGDGMSSEKRGRPMMYPILSLLKRFKDSLDAEVVKLWVQASYVFDVEVDGSPADVAAIASSNDVKGVPESGSSFTHNKSVKRTILSPASGSVSDGSIFSLLIAIISACWGIPKEAFNISGQGGSRATALVSSEPFTKVIEKIQNDFTTLLQELARIAYKLEGKKYNNEIEFIFPSAVKDTTSEQIKNISLGEQQKYISHKTAATMYAAEMDITMYDYDEQLAAVKDEQEQAMAMGFGAATGQPGAFGDDIGASPIHGQGKEDLKDQLNNI